ncbi:MAG: hypothetical protein U1E32_08480 [Rhodoglobus sp.]|nr:hypothetical protein [Rhodoglobus sp.]
MRAPTPQTLDPLGGLTARYFLLVTTLVAALIAAILLANHASGIVRPELQIAALAALVAALIQAIIGADPRFFPFGAWQHAGVFATLLLAAALDAASRADGPGQDGYWGALCITIMLFMSGSFRPWREIVVVTVVVSAGVGVIAGLHLGDLSQAAAAEQVIRWVTSVLAVGTGTAAFSRVLVTRVSAWQRENQMFPSADPVAAAEVQRDRQDFVDYRVGPFLEGLLESGTLTPVDIARARGLSAALRQQMLRDAERSWLDDAVDSFRGERAVAEAMTPEQRRAVGAIVAELRTDESMVPGSLEAVASSDTPASVTLTAELDARRVRISAFRAVLGATFARTRVDVLDDEITIVVQL